MVNKRPISRLKVLTTLEKKYGKSAVENLVMEELVKQEAAKRKINITNEDVDKEIAKIEEVLKTQGQTLDDSLAQENYTRVELQDSLRLRLQLEKIVSDGIEVADQEVTDYVTANEKYLEGQDITSEEFKSQVKNQLKSQKVNEAMQTWLQKAKEQAEIIYFGTYR
jgi:foldase protein PrsA